jgi:hypothetical protein
MENFEGTVDNIHKAIDSKGGGVFKQAETYFDNLFLGKLPPLSAQIVDLLVKLAPIWAICLLAVGLLQIVFGSLAVLLGLLGTALSMASLSGSGVIGSALGIIKSIVGLGLGLIMLVFLAKSLRGLFHQKREGWQGLFRAQLVSLSYAAFSWLMGILTAFVSLNGLGSIAGIAFSIILLPFWLLLFVLSFYLLFQIKTKFV